MSSIVKPLYDLCKSDVKFEWDKDCEKAFNLSKEFFTSDNVLVHYNLRLPIYLTSDSSGCGVGAVLSHKIEGEDRPIFFASSTL